MKTLTIYKDRTGKFRWTVLHRNGRVVDASTEGYSRYRDCRKNLLANGYGDSAPSAWVRGAKTVVVRVRP